MSKIPFYDIETGERVIKEWVIIDDIGEIAVYNGDDTDIIVPAEVDGITVEGIGSEAFAGKAITSIELPDSVKYVSYGAFKGCTALKTVKLSPSMTRLLNCFDGCTALETVYIPSTITEIAEEVFLDCPNVTLHVADGSAAMEYAIANDIPYVTDAPN